MQSISENPQALHRQNSEVKSVRNNVSFCFKCTEEAMVSYGAEVLFKDETKSKIPAADVFRNFSILL